MQSTSPVFYPIPEQLITTILQSTRFVVCGHMRPDGDCAYSVMAMGNLLKQLNKEYILVNEGNFLKAEISDFEKKLQKDIPQSWLNKETVGIIVDCSTKDRLGCYAESFERFTTLILDHHSSGFTKNQTNYIVPESPSTTLIVYKLFKALNLEITLDTAQMLFRGFVTDSGFFKFLGANSQESFEIVADLVRIGVNPAEEYAYISGNKPLNGVKFLSQLIQRTETYFNGKLVISHEEPSDLQEFGEQSLTADSYYAQMLAVKDVEAVALLKISNKIDNAVEVGLRASHNSKIDAGEIATLHGGGGHMKAAGVTIQDTYIKVKETIIKDFEKIFCNT